MTVADRRAARGRASALIDLGRFEEAAHLYAGLLREEPEDVQALCGMSRCLGKLERLREALELAERAAALAPEDDWPHRLRSAHLTQLHRPAEALRAAEEAVRLEPAGFAALLTLFEAQSGRRDAAAAATTALRVRELFPAQPESHNCLGRAAMLRRAWGEAAEAFRQALRLAPQEPIYQSNLALALERAGRRTEAMELFHQAVRTDPGNSNARRQLVRAIDRRLAIAGMGAGLGAAVVVNIAHHTGEVDPLTLAAGVILLAVAAGIGMRWLRLRRLDENVRRFYLHERRQHRRAWGDNTAVLAVVAVTFALAGGVVVWMSGSAIIALGALVGLLLLRYPGGRLWRRYVLPRLLARRGAARG